MARSMIFVGLLVAAVVVLGRRVPTGFVPEEDQGYVLANVQLPDAASLERTDEIDKKVERILLATPGVASVTTITGYSLVTQSYASNTGFFFITLKPWAERTTAAEHARGVIATANATFQRDLPEATVFAFGPPPIPGLGTGAGFSLFLQDKTGESPEFLAKQAQAFIAAARARPEIGNAITLYRATVPQIFADIDRDKVGTVGLQLADVNTTLGAFLGGQYINDFNRFGRLYKVYVQAEPQYRVNTDQLQFFYVRNAQGRDGAALDAGPRGAHERPRVHQPLQPLPRRGGHRRAGAGLQLGAGARRRSTEVAQATLPQGMDYSWNAMSYQEKAAEGKGAVVFIMALVFVFLILAAQYESWSLPFSVLLGTPFAVFGAFAGLWIARLLLAELREQRVRADRARDAHRARGQERDPDRGVRAREGARGDGARAGGARGGEAALPADPHDGLRVHPRRGAAAHGERRRRRGAQGDGDGGLQRHARGDDHRRLPRAGALRAHREARRQQDDAGTSPAPAAPASGGH